MRDRIAAGLSVLIAVGVGVFIGLLLAFMAIAALWGRAG